MGRKSGRISLMGKYRSQLEDNIILDIREIELGLEWIKLTQDRDH
jgi:hypothetical protein